MPHFGLICPPITGHVNPMAALGRMLMKRGHRVTIFQVSDLEAKAESEGVEFCAVGIQQFPPGTLTESVAKMASLTGLSSIRYAIECERRMSTLLLRYGPEAIAARGISALLVDQNEPAGASVAEYLDLPFASICTSLPLNREPLIPPPFLGWSYSTSLFRRTSNRFAHILADRFVEPIRQTLNTYRKHWNLPLLRTPDDSFSRLAQIAQMPREFDFPRQNLPPRFHYVGPLFDEHTIVPFPFEKLDGRPLIYGSLGTLQRADHGHFRIMAEACAGLNVQLVLSLGQTSSSSIPRLPGDPLIVNYAPQSKLLRRAAATITHCGMNTTQQSLYFGVPMIATPLTHDQPAIAARLARTGAGIVLSRQTLTCDRLRAALQAILPEDSSHRLCAHRLQQASRAAGGLNRAAEIIELSLQQKRPDCARVP